MSLQERSFVSIWRNMYETVRFAFTVKTEMCSKKKKKKVSLQLHQLLFLQMKRFIWESFSCEKQLSSTNFPFCEVSQVQMSLECDYLNIAMLLKLIILLDFRIQPL